MGEREWQRTAAAVWAAFDGGDLTVVGPLLAPDVRWHGGGPGGCHSRADALATITAAAGYRLTNLRRVADRILVTVTGPQQLHQMMILDDDGAITRLLDYTDPAVAESDLVPPAGAGHGRVDRLVPFVDVRDVPASARFYGVLGFEVTGEHREDGRQVWAALRSGDAELMLTETEEPVDPARQGVLLYLYTGDLDGLRVRLRAHGAVPSEITDGSPGPRRELRVDDPDGYCLMVAERAW